MARSSRLSVCLEMERRNSSQSHWIRSIKRQRTTPWMAGIGPASTRATKAARCASVSRGGAPGARPVRRPSGPLALKRSTHLNGGAIVYHRGGGTVYQGGGRELTG